MRALPVCVFSLLPEGRSGTFRGSTRRLLQSGMLAAALFAACSDGPTAPGPGILRVTVATTGGDRDRDGYELVIGVDRRVRLPANGRVDFTGIASGEHSLELEGLEANCSLGTGPDAVIVPSGGAVDVVFQVTCDATGIDITVSAVGLDAPAGLEVQVGDAPPVFVPTNVTSLVSWLQPGSHAFTVGALPSTCSLQGDVPVSVNVSFRSVSSITISISCTAVTAVIEVTVSTVGSDRDPNGYRIRSGTQSATVEANGQAWLNGVGAGTHAVVLEEVAANCTVSGGTQREVVAATGGTTRDTARVQFEVSCARTQKIAYGLWAAGISRINTAYADGSNPIQIGFGHSPSWVDERHLVYSTTYCYYYYGLPCTGGLVMVDTESGNDAGLLNGETGFDPAVSPAGDRIAFVRYDANQSGRLYLMAMGGFPANLVSLPGVLSASEPTWSPDGSRIAFACVILPGNADICLANADGTGVTRLSSDPGWDSDPAWSPDGGVLAFETTRFTGGGDIALLDISTRDVTRLTRGWDPAWSVTGMALIFASDDCVPPVGVPCPRGVFTINRDGTGRLRLTAGEHSSPSWRP